MNLSEDLKTTLENWINRIGRESVLSQSFTQNSVLSYSGGKDSNICLLFFQYLFQTYSIPLPKIFHLNHSIRDNAKQEFEIDSFLRKFFPNSLIKKKRFRVSQKK